MFVPGVSPTDELHPPVTRRVAIATHSHQVLLTLLERHMETLLPVWLEGSNPEQQLSFITGAPMGKKHFARQLKVFILPGFIWNLERITLAVSWAFNITVKLLRFVKLL